MFFVSVCAVSQTHTVTDDVPFLSEDQNMWGSGAAFNIDQNIELFRLEPVPNPAAQNVGLITPLLGGQFGAKLFAKLYIDIGANLIIEGFTGGSIDSAYYPVKINNIIPDSLSFDKGDWITIKSNYALQNDAKLLTTFPQAGRVALNFHFGFGMNVHTKICLYSCATIPMLPPWSTTAILGAWPPIDFNIFEIEQEAGTNNIKTKYPCMINTLVGQIPSICEGTVGPLELNIKKLGVTGKIGLPNSVTKSSIDGKCLKADGSGEPYLQLEIDILKYISLMGKVIPPPVGPALSSVVDALGQSFNLPLGVTASYTLFGAAFNIDDHNIQNFTFCPNINTTLEFPTKVLYRIRDPATTLVKESGFSSSITYHVGDDLEFKYPCNYEFMTLTPTYKIDSDEDNFTNITGDSIAFSFNMRALEFEIVLPEVVLLPPIPKITICIPWGYPCGLWDWCSGTSCVTTPAFSGLKFPETKFGIGPLWQKTLPVASLSIPWYDEDWGLKGFNEFVGTSFDVHPRPFQVSLAGVNILCKNDATGTLTATVLNGTAPYSYEWDNILVNNSALSIDNITNLPAGVHFVKVTDANGCSVFASYTLNEPAQELGVVNLVWEDVKCYNGSDAAANILMNGGTSPYNYIWSNGSVFDSISNVPIGNYTLTVTDTNGCTLDTNLVIDQPDSISIIVGNITNVLCKTDTTGNAIISVTGGSPTYSYLWSDGSTNQNLNNVPAGNYSVIVSDLNTCSNTQTLIITEPATPIIINSLVGTSVSCFGGNNGNITATVSGGVAPYSYAWFNSTGIQLSSSINIANNLIADTYQLIATDSNGCSTSQPMVINEPAAPINATFITSDVSCSGGNNGTINMTTTGGSIPYNSYNWSNGTTLEDNLNVFSGTHIITITDSKLCVYSDTIIINEPTDSLSIPNFSTVNILCFSDATGNVDITPFGGTVPYNYSWSSGQNTEDINNVVAGNYFVTVTDTNGCITIESYLLTEPTNPLNTTNTFVNVSCFGGADGSIDLTVTGGTSPYSYQWSNQDSLILSTTQQDIFGLEFGVYTVLITDTNGCQIYSSITITEPSAPVSSSITATAVNCFAARDGSINLTPNGGTIPYTFLWSNGDFTEDLTGLPTGWFNVVITDSNLCTSTDSIFISEPSAPLSASTITSNVNCNGGGDGGIQSFVNGGTTPYTFLWSNGETTQNIDSLTIGVYTLDITDVNGCIANSGGIINQPTAIAITNTVDSVSCFEFSDGHINVGVTGGTMPYQLQWADSSFLLSQYANDLYNITSGLYTIIVTDGNECEIRQDIVVFQPDTMDITYQTKDVSCFGGNDGTITTFIIGGTTPYTYFWNDSITTPNRDSLVVGNYSVVVSDYNNCTIEEFVQITSPEDILITGEITEISCKDAIDGEIYVLASGGTGSFMYQWATGELGQSLNELAASNYEIYVTDANGCMDTLMLILKPSELTCIQVSNTITSNGDGINDTWIIDKMELYPNASVQIFNKWGNLLYVSKGTYAPWDGTYNGSPLPSATYYYVINLSDGSPAITGPITIIR